MTSLTELQRMAANVREGLADLWCGWTHGGGTILRDPSGRVNWQCSKCGRWSDPVSQSDEANLLKKHMERRP